MVWIPTTKILLGVCSHLSCSARAWNCFASGNRQEQDNFCCARSPLFLSLRSLSMATFAATAGAAKLLSPCFLFTCKFSCAAPTNILRQHPPWVSPLQPQAPKSKRPVVVALSSLHELAPTPMYEIAENVGYSLASYYTSLGLFVISVPGLWSLIKRSVKSKRGCEYQVLCPAGVSNNSLWSVDESFGAGCPSNTFSHVCHDSCSWSILEEPHLQ